MEILREKIEALKQQYINEREYAKGALLRDIEKDLFPELKWRVGDEHMMISDVESVYKEEIPVVKSKAELKISPAQEASKWVKEGDTIWVEMQIAEVEQYGEYNISVIDGYGGGDTEYILDDRVKIAYKP